MRIIFFVCIFIIMSLFIVFLSEEKRSNSSLSDRLLHEFMTRPVSYELDPILTAMELRKDDVIIKTLNERINSIPDSDIIKLRLLYMSAKIGDRNLNNEFNKILMFDIPRVDLTKSSNDVSTTQGRIRYKLNALKKMGELGYKPSEEALLILKNDIKHFPKNEILVIEAASTLKSVGIELSAEETETLKKIVHRNWKQFNRYGSGDLISLGIQPDWEELFKTIPPDGQRDLLKAFLRAADNESRKKFIKAYGDMSKVEGKHVNIKLLIGATVNDKTSIERLGKIIETLAPSTISNLFGNIYDKLPDAFLLDVATVFVEKHDRIPKSCVIEMQKRGMTKELDVLTEKLEKESEKYFEKFNPEWDRALVSGWFINKYDREAYLNWLWNKHLEYPNNVFIASLIIKRLTASSSDNEPEKKWIRENPEKVAQAIKIILNFYRKPSWLRSLSTLSWDDSEYSLMVSQDRAEDALFLLPDEIFNKYFPNYRI